jgi:4-amino-4-deoxy-L-arabinose transferase-like glycosyltransferase
MIRAFDGTNRGYKYLLAAYFTLTFVVSRLSAAAMSCFFGALVPVFTYRIARISFSEKMARRAAWWTCFFPIMIIWSAQTIKEPIVVFLEALPLYCCLRMRADGFRMRHVLATSLALVVLSALRFYAAYVTGGVVLLTLMLPQFGRRTVKLGSGIAIGAIAISALYFSGATSNHNSEFQKWDLQQTSQFRKDIAAGTGSGVNFEHDLSTSHGFGTGVLVGAIYLLLSPFPWSVGGGNIRLLLTLPEQLVWWLLFFFAVVPGLRSLLRTRLGDIMPLLLFLLGLGLIYSATFGNIGVVYRQRGQLLPYLLIFASYRFERPSLISKRTTPCTSRVAAAQ